VTLATDYREKRDEIRVKRVALKTLYDEREKTTDEAKVAEKSDAIKSANLELSDLVDKFEPIQDEYLAKEANDAALKAMGDKRQVNPTDDNEDVNRAKSPADEIVSKGYKSIGEMLDAAMEVRGIKSLRGFRGDLAAEDLNPVAIKTLITSADLSPLEDRQSVIVPSAQEERTIADLMLPGTTTAQKITYFVETTFTNAAVETDEGAAKPESAIDFTLREDDVRKIATWIPVTDEMMEDVPAFESYLRGRLGFMVRQREELQLLQGAGTGITIQGVYNRTGVQTESGYGKSTIDSILSAITKVQANAFIEPTAMAIHPLDWFDVRTSKDTTGNYLLGPATQNPADARPWGLQVRVTTNALQNTALVGAFNQAQVFRRTGISIAISTENEDYFIKNKLAVRAEERLALAVYRPAAFCKVEAIVVGS
jgi:HK97 family phage major capsid protein